MDFDIKDGMDTKTLSESGVWMTVKTGNGRETYLAPNGKPIRLLLLGPDSKEYRKIQRKQVRERIQRAAGGQVDTDVEEDDGAVMDFLASCTLGWENVTAGGKDVTFTPAAARQFYDAFPIIRDQADSFIANRLNFIKASKPA